MRTTRVFQSGNSQAVRIPKEFRLPDGEVEITKDGDAVILRPKRRSWAPLIESLDRFTEDYLAGRRRQPRLERRKRSFS